MAIRNIFKKGATSKAVILPSQICDDLDIKDKDRMDIKRVGNKIIITKIKEGK